jgi:hypothetical protein
VSKLVQAAPIEGTRVSTTVASVLALRLSCNLSGDGDEKIFQQQYGPDGSFGFWVNFLSGVVPLPSFIHAVSIMRAERWDRIDVTRDALRAAFIEAFQGDEAFFRGNLTELASVKYFREIASPELIKVLGRKAADWLASSPKWRHLAPATMAAFLRGEKPEADPSLAGGIPKAKTGPKGDLMQRVASMMLADLRCGRTTVEALGRDKKESLAAHYGAGRTTVTEALKLAVSQFAAGINSDN